MFRRFWIIVLALLLASCTGSPFTAETPQRDHPLDIGLDNYGLAPDLENEVWLNIDHPLRLADLRGKVVLVEMWTFG